MILQMPHTYDNVYRVVCSLSCGVVKVVNPKTLRLPSECPKCGIGSCRLLSTVDRLKRLTHN